jgi:hypothetical protein
MILTQLEGAVARENWASLKGAFEKALQHVPAAILQTYLIHEDSDSNIWRILTIWHSRHALQDYQQSTETPEGVLIFREAGTEPTLSVYAVIDYSRSN